MAFGNNAGGGGRSATSSHFAKNFGSATVGTAEFEAFGIPLDNDIRDAPVWQLYSLGVLLVVLFIKPKFSSRSTTLAFWTAIIGIIAAGGLAEVTWIPILTTIVYTRTAYPYLIVISHCIAANASYRAVHGDQTPRVRAFVFGFFLYGFGGSIVSDVLLGLPATALAHPRIIPCHLLGWVLIWCCPFDWVYQNYFHRSDSFLHYLIVAAEAVDAVTTPMGRISRGARELRNKTTAPIMGGLLAGIGGGILRFLAGEPGTASQFATLQSGFYKTLGYSLLFWTLAIYRCDYHNSLWNPEDGEPDASFYAFGALNHCPFSNGSDTLRVILVSAHVLWTLLCDMGVTTGHPFVWLAETMFHGKVAATLVSTLRLGPPSQQAASHDKVD